MMLPLDSLSRLCFFTIFLQLFLFKKMLANNQTYGR